MTLAFTVTLGLLFMAAFRAYEARRQAVPPAPLSAPAPSAPAPIVLRPVPPSGPVYLRRPMDGGDSPENRRFDPAHPGQMFRPTGPVFRSPDPRDRPDVLPPGNGPDPAPSQNVPSQNVPTDIPPRFPAEPSSVPPSAASGSEASPNQALPAPYSAPGPSQPVPNTSAGQ